MSDRVYPNGEYATAFLETLLYKVALDVKGKVDDSDDSICLIFIYDDYRGAFVLRASTKPEVNLGTIEIAPNQKDKMVIENIKGGYRELSKRDRGTLKREFGIDGDERLLDSLLDKARFKELSKKIPRVRELEQFGFTKLCIYTEKSFLVSNASKHPILTKPSKNIRTYSFIGQDELSSVLCFYTELEKIKLIIRMETKDHRKAYADGDLNKVKRIVNQYQTQIDSCLFLSNLVGIGFHTDLRELCDSATDTIASLLNAKGCSIFLLDESISSDCLLPYSSDEYENEPVCENCEKDCNKRVLGYRCFGTTGLCVIKPTTGSRKNRQPRQRDPIGNPYGDMRAAYQLFPSENRKGQKPTLSLTNGVIWSKQNAYVNVHEKKKKSPLHILNQFTGEFKIQRKTGEGKCSEDFWEKRIGSGYEHSQCILYAALCFRERNSKYFPAMGAIRILKPIDPNLKEPNYFTPSEKHLFFSFSEQLSKAILHAKYINFLNELTSIRSIQGFYKYVVREIPKFIGGTDCAIFIKDENKLMKKAEWDRGAVRYHEEGSSEDIYNLDNPEERGYTKWVANNSESLIFNSLEELKEFSMNIPRGAEPRHKKKHKDDDGPERYLGIPIHEKKDGKGDLLGVFRICKSSEETLFTKDDTHILSKICERLAEEIQKSRLMEEKRKESERYFSKKLIDIISSHPELCRIMSQLRSGLERSDTDISDIVLALIEEDLNHYSSRSRLKVFRDFGLFNKEVLKEIPSYRDHFIHQYVVYLLGLYIIVELTRIKESGDVFSSDYRDKTAKKANMEKGIRKLWFLTTLYHDISYPLAETSNWYQKFISRFLSISSENKIDFQSEILKYLVLSKDQSTLERIDRIVGFHERMRRSDPDLRTKIFSELVSLDEGIDHAVLSALIVMDENIPSLDQEICGSSILLHNRLYKRSGIEPINFHGHPLAFLLIFCDFLHEWGREMSDEDTSMFHTLNNIIITRDRKELLDAGFDEAELPDSDAGESNYVYAHIIVPDSKLTIKMSEARDLTSHLRSSRPFVFCFTVNHRSCCIPQS